MLRNIFILLTLFFVLAFGDNDDDEAFTSCSETTKIIMLDVAPDFIYASHDGVSTSFDFDGCNFSEKPASYDILIDKHECKVVGDIVKNSKNQYRVTCIANVSIPASENVTLKELPVTFKIDGKVIKAPNDVQARIPRIFRSIPSTVHIGSAFTIRLETEGLFNDDAREPTNMDHSIRIHYPGTAEENSKYLIGEIKTFTPYCIMVKIPLESDLIWATYNNLKIHLLHKMVLVAEIDGFRFHNYEPILTQILPPYSFVNYTSPTHIELKGRNLEKLTKVMIGGFDCSIATQSQTSVACSIAACDPFTCIGVHDIQVTTKNGNLSSEIHIGDYEIMRNPGFAGMYPAQSLPDMTLQDLNSQSIFGHYMKLLLVNNPIHAPIILKIGGNEYTNYDFRITSDSLSFPLQPCKDLDDKTCAYPAKFNIEIMDEDSRTTPLWTLEDGFTYTTPTTLPAITSIAPAYPITSIASGYQIGDPGDYSFYGYNLASSAVSSIKIKKMLKGKKDLILKVDDPIDDLADILTIPLDTCTTTLDDNGNNIGASQESKCMVGEFEIELSNKQGKKISVAPQHIKFKSQYNPESAVEMTFPFSTKSTTDHEMNLLQALDSFYKITPSRIVSTKLKNNLIVLRIIPGFHNVEPTIGSLTNTIKIDIFDPTSPLISKVKGLQSNGFIFTTLERCKNGKYEEACNKSMNTLLIILIIIIILGIVIFVTTMLYGRYMVQRKAQDDMLDEHNNYVKISDEYL